LLFWAKPPWLDSRLKPQYFGSLRQIFSGLDDLQLAASPPMQETDNGFPDYTNCNKHAKNYEPDI